MLSRLASTAVTVRLHKQIFFESEATSMATFLWKVSFLLAWLLRESGKVAEWEAAACTAFGLWKWWSAMAGGKV